jgi:hypothetical protein
MILSKGCKILNISNSIIVGRLSSSIENQLRVFVRFQTIKIVVKIGVQLSESSKNLSTMLFINHCYLPYSLFSSLLSFNKLEKVLWM